jgi:hypothetical protein
MPTLPSISSTVANVRPIGTGSKTERRSTGRPAMRASRTAVADTSTPSAGRPRRIAAATIRPGPQPTSSTRPRAPDSARRSTSSAGRPNRLTGTGRGRVGSGRRSEEVRDPARTIVRAIPLALGIVVAIYVLVGVAVLAVLGPDGTARSVAPLQEAVAAGSLHALAPLVRVGAVAASLGVLLSAMAGVGRTTLAMARDHELPAPLAAVHPRFAVPHRAELLLGLIVIAVVSTTDVRGAIGFSSTGVLVYYAITNASAWTLPGQARTWRRPVAALGLLGCLLLVATLPPVSVVTGLGVLAGAVLVRAVLQSREPRKQQP